MGLIWKRICAGVELCVSTPATYGMDYLKYYSLEKYLFGDDKDDGDVRKNFLKNGFLTPEEFFCIIIWKANRRKTKIKAKFPKERKKLDEDVRC